MIFAAVVAFAITGALGPVLIPLLRKLKFGQSILEIGPNWHKSKQGTPTMGGILFIAGTIAASLLIGIPAVQRGDPRLLIVLLSAAAFGVIGFLDDYIKVVKKRNLGLTAKQKSFLQLLVAIAMLVSLAATGCITTAVYIPFFNVTIELSWFYYLLAVITIVGFVNGVNLTDGIDGLATGVTIPVMGFFAAAALFLNAEGSVGIFAAAVFGALFAFLIFNFHPAKVFMGDTGSLFLGGAVTACAFALNIPVIIFVCGLIYLIETASVMLQVTYFKLTHGKRLFKMAPLHHHFEMCGLSEVKIMYLFSAFTIVMCVLSYVGIMNYFVL